MDGLDEGLHSYAMHPSLHHQLMMATPFRQTTTPNTGDATHAQLAGRHLIVAAPGLVRVIEVQQRRQQLEGAVGLLVWDRMESGEENEKGGVSSSKPNRQDVNKSTGPDQLIYQPTDQSMRMDVCMDGPGAVGPGEAEEARVEEGAEGRRQPRHVLCAHARVGLRCGVSEPSTRHAT